VSLRAVVRAVVVLAMCGTSTGRLAHAQFETRASYPLDEDNNPVSFALGDFNGDGVPDVAEVNASLLGSVQIFLGNGDGTFRAGATYSVGRYPFFIVASSLRNNGVLDLLVSGAGADDVYVMLGNGDGTFQAAISYAITAESYMAIVGDFTGDGIPDIVAVEGANNEGIVCDCVEVLPGNGDGTFGVPITTPLPYGLTGYSIAAGDFNGDGKLDLAVGGESFPNYEVAALLGNGNGTFNPDGFYLLSAAPGGIATGYFTASKKKIDLAIANEPGVDVLLGDGNGTFQRPLLYDTLFPSWVIAQDFSGDGKVDLAASKAGGTSEAPAGVTVFNGNGNGTFQAGVTYPAGEGIGYLSAGDLNGDHLLDLVLLDTQNGAVITLLNTGVVSFSPTTPLNFKKQAVGTTSAPQAVTLTNTGTTELKIQSMKASAEFAMTSTCGARVAPSANCTISATFSPTKQGAKQGTITIIDNASSKPQVIELLGTGT
jgi:hypothetical protein